MLTLGSGSKKVLAWSQMHGNESTTTKAVFDFLAFMAQKEIYQTEISHFLKNYTLHIIPMLNPDGSAAYTRVNGNLVDLNRDSQDLSQKESRLLRTVFNDIQPDLCLNLHDQRTIFGVSSNKPATVSFLAPSADEARTVNSTREIAMLLIAKMFKELSKDIPGQIGRYDDGFNLNCIGDTFTNAGVPTILFEAGHYKNDYNRDITRAYIFKALLVVFGILEVKENVSVADYFSIPENQKNYCDIVLKDVRLHKEEKPQNIAIQFIEELVDGQICFTPSLLGLNTLLLGHKEVLCNGDVVVFNDTENVSLGEKLTFVYNKITKNEISLRI
ncbi:putative carboxypeptidase (putative secreted protein) [unidentified eubacterium SCB49]|nr:putative carboxypeptidase (putative secreted protein) [unidentified eubacterium SCB49]